MKKAIRTMKKDKLGWSDAAKKCGVPHNVGVHAQGILSCDQNCRSSSTRDWEDLNFNIYDIVCNVLLLQKIVK